MDITHEIVGWLCEIPVDCVVTVNLGVFDGHALARQVVAESIIEEKRVTGVTCESEGYDCLLPMSNVAPSVPHSSFSLYAYNTFKR